MPEWLKDVLAGPSTTVPLAGKALGLSRNGSYDAAARGEIHTVRFGKRLIVPTAWLRKVLKIEDDEAAA